jgi:glycosyltransferase involved in cell wall biosynthesis
MRVVTLVGPADLPQARVLARSLREHAPAWSHELLLMGSERASARLGDAGELRSICEELDGIEIEALLALHDEQELAALLLPTVLAGGARQGSDPVLHLPPSVWVLGSLQPLADQLSHNAVMLAPRITDAELPDDGLQPTNEDLELAGRVERTMAGVAPLLDPDEFLEWWDARVQQTYGSLDARRSGDRPEDRPWLARLLELAPARFDTAVLEDPGCNLSMWNLHEHTVSVDDHGERVDGQGPLRFLNLPGFDPARPFRLNALASRARVSRSPALHDLGERYAQHLLECGWSDVDLQGQIGRLLPGGLVYDEALRALYRSSLALGAGFDDPFADDAFLHWLRGPAPRGSRHGITRYVFHRVARERPDVVRAYPDLDGADGAEYVKWCRAFGRMELGIPEQFMPGAGSQAAPRASDPAASAASPATPAAVLDPEPAAPRAVATAAGPLAVRLTGYLGHALGLGAAGRGYAHALRSAGVPVSTVTVPLHHLELPVQLESQYGRHAFEDLVHDGAHGFEVVAVNADELPDLVGRLGDAYFEGPRIGIWGWETNRIPPRWQRAFALVDEIWVYSRFMAENIGTAAPVPVLALPPPVEAPAPPAAPNRLGVGDGFLFLFVFDYMSTIQRKNPVGLIEAFKRAFNPGEGPRLLIKTLNAPLRPLAEEEVLWAAHGRPDIDVIDRSLSAAELNGLMAACDCYASLHRAEGFGLTIAEAMAIGKPVIATGYSGNVDFMTDENSYLVDFTIARVGAECEIYPPDGEWAEPNVEHGAQLMRRVYRERGEAARKGARASADIARQYSPQATGRGMRDRLEQLAASGAARPERVVAP